MSFVADPRVDAYIDALPGWQQAICREVRELVHAAGSEVTETVKRRVQPYFVLDGNICALLAAKRHAKVLPLLRSHRRRPGGDDRPARFLSGTTR